MSTPQVGGADILTRTTLQIDTAISAGSISELKGALQRVPGVLLAEINGTGGLAMVAHDSAVSMASLLAAVAATGARARVVADARVPAVSDRAVLPVSALPMQRLMLIVAAVVLLQALFGTVSPTLAKSHLLLPILLSLVWAFVFVSVSFKRRT